MLNLTPLFSHLKRQYKPMRELADEVVELSPASTAQRTAAVFLPDEVERIRELASTSTWSSELNRISFGTHIHPATMGYRFKYGLIGGRCLYAAGSREPLDEKGRTPILVGNPDRFRNAFLCTNNIVEKYFGHWLNDGLCMELLAEQHSAIPLVLEASQRYHENGYRKLVDLHPKKTVFAQIENIWLLDDIHMNDGRIARIAELRRRICNIKVPGPRRIYMARGATGVPRNLVNSGEVVNALKAEGFVEVVPEQETPEALVGKFCGAEICLGVEGSALVHALMAMPRKAALLAIEPPSRFTTISKIYADAVGIIFGFTVADKVGDHFSMPISRLLKAIELVEQRRVHL